MSARSLHLLAHCGGHEWAVSPAHRAVYVLDDGDPAAIGWRVPEAVAALNNPRPRLRVLPGGGAR